MVPESGVPFLTDLKILTPGVTITPVFDPSVNTYGMDIPAGIDTVTLQPVKRDGQRLFVTLKSRGYTTVTKAVAEVTDTIMLTASDFEDNYVNMDLTICGDDAERTVTFRVNKWFSAAEMSKQSCRAQFHVTPQINFMNDPNGLVYDPTDGYWHMFYQYSPQYTMGQQSWAHVRSRDLVSWEQMPLALQVDDIGRMYSGSAVALTAEEAARPGLYDGIFADNAPGESRLILFYTNAGTDGKQRQMTAYSGDHGVTWTKYNGGKPIIDNDMSLSGNKFGDPKVFRIPEDTVNWYMVTIGKAQLFASSDLIRWTKVQDIRYIDGETYAEAPDGIIFSECPGLNPVTQEETGEQKWIYSGSDAFFVVGSMSLDADTGYYRWQAESRRIVPEGNFYMHGSPSHPENFGKYAGMTFYEDGTGMGRTIGISWIKDSLWVNGKQFSGYQTLPYEWKLKKNRSGGYAIINQPVEEVNALHGGTLFSADDRTVTPADGNILESVTGAFFDLQAEITPGSATSFGFKVRKGTEQEIVLSYSPSAEKMRLDVSQTVACYGSGVWQQSAELVNGRIRLRLLVDQGVVEAFGNDGEAAISTAVMTDNDKTGMEFFVEGGSVTLNILRIYRMNSIYTAHL